MALIAADIEAALSGYHTNFDEERLFLRMALDFAAAHPEDCCSRALQVGHFTASAWVLSPARDAALLIHHRALDRWFQPGGHTEREDLSLAAAAARELAEECGMDEAVLLQTTPFDLDIHVIPAKGALPEHLHYDLRYAFLASADARLLSDPAEVKGLCWVPLKQLEGRETQQALRRMALKSVGVALGG
jgi:8-oxo-dGTP pyrophosphatase MutT (NUDIX family)